jgi:hypothetical protein
MFSGVKLTKASRPRCDMAARTPSKRRRYSPSVKGSAVTSDPVPSWIFTF